MPHPILKNVVRVGFVCFLLITGWAGVPSPIGLWAFDVPGNLTLASVGRDLQLVGTHAAIAGAQWGDGAVQIGVGSHYVCTHEIAPNGSGQRVNRFSLAYDFRVPSLGPWYCFFQTDPSNTTDGDCFVHTNSGTVGVGATGYSTVAVRAGVWHRLVVAADHSAGLYRIYLDGDLILDGQGQAADGRFALSPTFLVFADEDGEDTALDVTRFAMYDACLSAADAAELGGVLDGGASNGVPVVDVEAIGPTEAVAGQALSYEIAASDPDGDAVQVRMDWGDGTGLSGYGGLMSAGQRASFAHTYVEPGRWTIRALARDSRGRTGTWTKIRTVAVSGTASVEFETPPYLQNVKPDGITVMWELSGVADAEVEFGPDSSYGSRAIGVGTATGSGSYVYKSVLTGLEPGRTYQYRTWIGGQEAKGGQFITSPAGAEGFAFSVWADSQGSNHGTYSADPLEPTKSMFRHMAAHGIDFGVTAGDLAENGASYTDVRQYYVDRVAVLLGTVVPWFVAWGNHDGGSTTVIRKYADLPSQLRPGFTAGYGSYSFDYAGCHFICLDNASRDSDIVGWLEGDLQSDANRNARFTFLFVHVPPYCELWISGDSFLRSRLVPLMEAYGVDVCFSGHTHEYSRGYRNGVYYCITGGGSWLDIPEALVYDWDHMTVGGVHAIPGVPQYGEGRGGGLINEYVRVDVQGDTFTASMIGFDPDGTEVGVLDRFTMSRSPGSSPPARPQIAGPATADVSSESVLVLTSSAFSDADTQDSHVQSVWRVSRAPDMEVAEDVVLEGVTGPRVLSWSVPLRSLWPGQTVYASVRHLASDGMSSLFADPIAIQLTPDLICREDFEGVGEFTLPAGWVAEHHTTVIHATLDPDDPLSNRYLTWTVVSASRLAEVMGANRVNVASVFRGNSLYAESDHRTGVQLQYVTTPDFDLAGWTNVVLMFRSNYMQNQDNLAALEYSVNRGTSWRPVLYCLDTADVMTAAGGGVDAVATFKRVDPDGVPTAGGISATGGTYGAHVLSRPFEDLAAFISARTNDDTVESKRTEQFRLSGADAQAQVRFRFAFVGTASWFWGIDDFSLYGTSNDPEPLQITRVAPSAQGLELGWTGPAGPYQIQSRSDWAVGEWQDVGNEVDAGSRVVTIPVQAGTGFFRIRLAR